MANGTRRTTLRGLGKRYTPLERVPGRMTGGLGTLATASARYPVSPTRGVTTPAAPRSILGVQIPQPRAAAAGGMVGGVEVPQLGGISGQMQRAGLLNIYPGAVESPRAGEYYRDIAGARGVEAEREAERTGYVQRALGAVAPGAAQYAGRPETYWQSVLTTRVGDLRDQFAAERAQLEQQRNANVISNAAYEAAMRDITMRERRGFAKARADVENERRLEGEGAARMQAEAYLAAAGGVPTERTAMARPEMVPLAKEEPFGQPIIGGGQVVGGARGVMQQAQEMGFQNWGEVPDEIKRQLWPGYRPQEFTWNPAG